MRAKGHSAGGNQMPRTTVGFEVDTFVQLAAQAEKRGISLAELIRELVELGLISEEQEKAHACRTSTLPHGSKARSSATSTS
jgi:predicted DNA-binding ribbon-helix-helix protein